MDSVQLSAFQSFEDQVSLDGDYLEDSLEPINFGDIDISQSASVCNLGGMMDGCFSMTTHIKTQVRLYIHFLHKI